MSEGPVPYLELKSERVQRELAQLVNWQGSDAGLEGTFRFDEGSQTLAFLRRLAELLEAHAQPPRRLALTGPTLYIALGAVSDPGISAADLALAGRISALGDAVDGAVSGAGSAPADASS
jgi:pterin-4a-carbinolamine dehydratase